MKHEQLKEILPLYIDGGLDKDEAEMIEAHLAECEQCRGNLAKYQNNYDFLSAMDDVEVDEGFLLSVMERIREEKSTTQIQEQIISKNKGENNGKNWLEWLREMFRFRLRVPLGALGVGLAVILLIVIINPFKGVQYEDGRLQNDLPRTYQSEINNQVQLKGRQLQSPEMDNMQFVQEQANDLGGGQTVPETIERKIIQTADLRVEVKDIQSADGEIINLIYEIDGFISNSRRWEVSNQRQYSSYTLRIPADKFTEALSKVESLGKVKDRSSYGQDVTEEYIDVESRLKNLTLQEERYRELLDRATVVEDILKIEQELERVRSSIESLQGRMNYLNDQIDLSTIYVELMEPEPITSSDVGIVNALRQALRSMVDTFYDLIVRLGIIIPYLILIVLAYLIYRIFRKKRK